MAGERVECVGECCATGIWRFDCPCCEGTGEWESSQECATCGGGGTVSFNLRDRRRASPPPPPAKGEETAPDARGDEGKEGA